MLDDKNGRVLRLINILRRVLIAAVVLAIKPSSSSKLAGGLLALTGILGIIILSVDRILWQSLSGQHAYGLIVFVIIDFVVAAFVLAKASKLAFTVAAGWSGLRIIIQFADIYFGPAIGLTYSRFADYLFNPTASNPPNPTGVPGAVIDLILILEIIVVLLAWGARSSGQQPTKS